MAHRMALGDTVHQFRVTLSDVDRGVYEALEFRVARHPSESGRYLLCRTLAYCLCLEPGLVFSRGGLSTTDEPALSVVDPTGVTTRWIEIGAPSADRLHRAAKAAPRVDLFTHVEFDKLSRELSSRTIHRAEEIAVHRLSPALLDALETRLQRTTTFELVRTSDRLYLSIGGETLEGEVETRSVASLLV